MPTTFDLHAYLAELRQRGKNTRFCVVGAGHGGLAMAGHLGLLGFPVTLYNRTAENLAGVQWHGGVTLTGVVDGFGPVALATSDPAAAAAAADVIMVVTPSTAHRPLAAAFAPHLRPGQIVVLNPGRTGGALEFARTLAETGATTSVVIAEAQTFIYASRALSRHEARIYRVKNAVPVATLPAYWLPETLPILRAALPAFIAGHDVLATSLENIGAIFHPALTLLSAGWIETTRGNFDYYLDGISPSVARFLELMDGERVAVATALGVATASAREWLYVTYDAPGGDLFEAIHNTAAYRGIKAPPSIAHRYVFEDVPMSLVPLSSLGAMLGTPTPTIDLVIRLAEIMHACDYRAVGRTVERLGLAGKSVKEIRQFVVGARD
jgi:opine dehydrogenase